MSLTEPKEPRKAWKHIAFKVGIGLIILIIALVFSSIISSTEIRTNDVSTSLFLLGGVFLIIGAFRDFFNSVVLRKIMKKSVDGYLKSEEANYFYGYGVGGEDVVAGFILIVISILFS